MRVENYLRVLAATAALSAGIAPTARASYIGEGGGGLLPTDHRAAVPRQFVATGWGLLAPAGSGTVAVVGAGVASAQSHVPLGRKPGAPVMAGRRHRSHLTWQDAPCTFLDWIATIGGVITNTTPRLLADGSAGCGLAGLPASKPSSPSDHWRFDFLNHEGDIR
jgi:hypothetical protein